MLSDAQITSFWKNGFLALEAITTAGEIEAMRAIYDDLFEQGVGRDSEDRIDLASQEGREVLPQILRPSKYVPQLAETQLRANARAIAAQLLGEDTEFVADHAIRKPGGHGVETPWHQDEAYWDPALAFEALSIWVPLQEATLENGCMQFLPGIPEDVVPHHHIDEDPEVAGLVVDDWNVDAAVACPLPVGGATVHHCRTLHYTGANKTDTPRRAYILVFRRPPATRAEPRDFYWLDAA